jgi:hypothetical protein
VRWPIAAAAQRRKASVRAAGLHGQSGVASSARDYLRRDGGGPSLLMASTKVLVFGDRLVVDMRPMNLSAHLLHCLQRVRGAEHL